jgi:hypothetical protein
VIVCGVFTQSSREARLSDRSCVCHRNVFSGCCSVAQSLAVEAFDQH